MAIRRALVVDDSKSARAFLGGILVRHELIVDNAASAEEAIEYLGRERPDVIFMDHLMPGMDGFQAVRAIKNDPRTAAIPILMYTSQEGELYLSQARALGAVGVVAKHARPEVVGQALEELRNLEGPPGPGLSLARPDEESIVLRPPEPPPDLRHLIEAMLRDQVSDLRQFVATHLDSHAGRIVDDVRVMLREKVVPAPPTALTTPMPAAAVHPRGSGRGSAGPLVRGLAVALVLVAATAAGLGALWYRTDRLARTLNSRIGTLQEERVTDEQRIRAQLALVGAMRAPPPALTSDAATLIEPVPLGEAPFGDERVAAVRTALERLRTGGFRGTVQLRAFAGRYCLAAGGAELAPDLTPVVGCAAIGSPAGAKVEAAPSAAFSEMIAAVRAAANGAFDIEVVAGMADTPAIAYPPVAASVTAAEWNAVAAQNNRVEVHWNRTAP